MTKATAHIARITSLERETRKACGFEQGETDLPDVKRAAVVDSDAHAGWTEKLLTRLGKYNPLGRPVGPRDTLWMFDNTAFRNAATGQWEAEFVAAVFERDSGVGVDDVAAKIAEKLGLASDAAERETIRQRVDLFTREILPGRKVHVDFAAGGKKQGLDLGPGGRHAISSDRRKIPGTGDGELVRNRAKVPATTEGQLEFETIYAEPEGWAVISDVDDTIKITQTSSPLGILYSTFVSPAKPVEGMPELYAWMKQLLEPDEAKTPAIFYLSASPYNLYPFLREFRQEYFPSGQLILREASWMNLAGLLSNLTLGVQDYKVDRIDKIHSWVPQRKMICIGDSTQSDAEAYAEIYKKYPGWIRLILIRKVSDIAASNIGSKNEPARFEKAFADLPRNVWHVFDTPLECQQIIADVVIDSSSAKGNA